MVVTPPGIIGCRFSGSTKPLHSLSTASAASHVLLAQAVSRILVDQRTNHPWRARV